MRARVHRMAYPSGSVGSDPLLPLDGKETKAEVAVVNKTGREWCLETAIRDIYGWRGLAYVVPCFLRDDGKWQACGSDLLAKVWRPCNEQGFIFYDANDSTYAYDFERKMQMNVLSGTMRRIKWTKPDAKLEEPAPAKRWSLAIRVSVEDVDPMAVTADPPPPPIPPVPSQTQYPLCPVVPGEEWAYGSKQPMTVFASLATQQFMRALQRDGLWSAHISAPGAETTADGLKSLLYRVTLFTPPAVHHHLRQIRFFEPIPVVF